MTARVLKLSSGASTNLTQVSGADQAATLKGYEIVNTNAAARYVKLYWGGGGAFSGGSDSPVVGTDAPKMTILVPALGTTTGFARQSYPDGIAGGNGKLWMATTVSPADSANDAVGAGDLLISIFFE